MHQLKHRILKIVEILPLASPAAIASFAVPAIVLLLFDAFKSIYVWPLGLATSYVAVRLLKDKYSSAERPGSQKEQRICDALVVGGVILWVTFNAFFTFQHVYTNRDPATYANAGIWLIDHESLRMERPDLFDGIDRVHTRSAGFHEVIEETPEEDIMHAQGAHLLPAFLGLGGRIVGIAGMFHLAPIFGGTALLALYALGRQLVKSRWAVVATMAFATSLPLIYFSRDTYTEPLTATFIFGGLALLYASMKNQKSSPWWLLAGLTLGASVMMRIDSFLAIIAVIPALAIWLALSSKKNRPRNIKVAGSFIAGLTLTSFLGWLDLRLLSTDYLDDLSAKFTPMMYMLAGVMIASTLFIFLAWRTNALKWADKQTKPWRTKAATVLALLTSAILATQPLWRTVHSKGVNQFMVSLQDSLGMDPGPAIVDGVKMTRNFSEYAVHWVTWYIGPVVMVLGLVGIIYAVNKVLSNKRDIILLPIVSLVTTASLVYFIEPSITPDHVWASRRFVPIIIPGIALFAAFGLQQLWNAPKQHLFGMDGKIIATVLATLAITAPLIISLPFVSLRERTSLSSITDMCDSLPENSAVLWIGTGKITALQPTYSLCDVPVGGIASKHNLKTREGKQSLSQVALRAEGMEFTPVIAVFGREANLLPAIEAKKLTEVHHSIWQEMEYTLLRPPHLIRNHRRTIRLGVIRLDGAIDLLPATVGTQEQ